MQLLDNNIKTFFALLRAGLWNQEVRLSSYEPIEWKQVYELAEYQSVIGLITAGLEYVVDKRVPQKEVLAFVGTTLQLEQRNRAMNNYLQTLITKLDTAGIPTVLLKGQGLAQCYEKPLWRACGDIDLFLSEENYKKAQQYLKPLATSIEPEETYKKHLGMTIEGWMVELHGNLYSSLSRRIERTLDEIYSETFHRGDVRKWDNGGVQVLLMTKENDVIYVFTHILQHYIHGGIGLRQICDWCRLLWNYRSELNVSLIELRLKKMGLISEWKSFAFFAVNDLGMPKEAIPLFENKLKWCKKAHVIKEYVIKTGNFGHRNMEYVKNEPYLLRKLISLKNTIKEARFHLMTFPLDTNRFFFYYIAIRLKAMMAGE